MFGIPNMKLEKQYITRRVKLMEEEGVVFKTGVDVGNSVKGKDLLKEYDAVVIATGSKTPRDLSAPGRDANGIYYAVDFLSDNTRKVLGMTKKQIVSAKDKNVIIVGGGDTGNDCVGTCIRQGCKSVTQLEMMPKLPDSRAESNPWPQWPRVCKTDYGQEEAIAMFGHDPRIYQTTVKEFVKDKNGNLKAVKTVALESKKDEKTGRMMMQEVAGSEKELPCELLLIAAGFVGCEKYVADAFGLEKDGRGNVVTENGGHKTSVSKVFAAGDARRGQSLVVWAIAEGRACAKEVDEFLMGYTNMI